MSIKIYKPKELNQFTAIPNQIFRSKGVSMQASGLYCWLFSHKSGHGISVSFIAGHFKNGRDAINTALNELIDHGFLEKKQLRSKGKFSGYDLHLTLGKPVPGKPKPDKPKPENPKQINNNINNTNNYIRYNNIMPHFIDLFPDQFKPKTKANNDKWIQCLDKLERLDGYDLREVYRIVKYFRSDQFWSNQFLTLLKLRNKDKNGLKYIDRFADLFNKESKPNAYKKIKGLKQFYLDSDFNLFAQTNNQILTEFHLKQILSDRDIKEVIKHLRNDNQ
tara:strand:- start:6072 stop:6902 length:831 start_codon:yes stop_codon:yes gene_type:complete